MNLPFWQRTEGVRANNKRAVLVVYSKESPCLLRCTIALPKKSSVEPDAPTTAQSYGMLFCFRRRSEGVQGAFRSSPACIAAHQLRRRGILAEGLTRRLRRGSAGASYEMLFCFSRRSEGVQGAFRSPPACIAAHQLRRRGILAEGLTRRLRRGLGLAVPRGAHTFLSVAKEKCAKESQRHGDSGKKPFIAHF